MLAIYMKEMRSLMRSIYGWAFLAVITFFTALYFVVNNIFNGNPYGNYTMSSFLTVLFFVLPLLTMRAYSEERKQKTDQLLLTSPLSITEIIFGKFFAIVTMLVLSSVVFVVGILIMSIYGEVPFGENFLGVLGYILFGCVLIAIGMFLSAVTEHQFVAAILTYCAFLGILLVPSVMNMVFPTSFVTNVVNWLDIIIRVENLFNGMIILNDVVFVFSVIAVFLLLTYLFVGRNNFRIKTKNNKSVFFSLAVFAVVLIAIIGVNVLLDHTAAKDLQVDVSARKLYSIGDETKVVLDGLEDEVCINIIGSESNVDPAIVLYASSYNAYSSKVKVEYRSNLTDPLFYAEYTDTEPEYSSMIVTYKDDFRIISYADCYEQQYINGSYALTGVDIEGQITAAIHSMSSGEANCIYELAGHGDIGLDASIVGRLTKGGYKYNTLNLISVGTIPEDAECIVISGPQYDLSDTEIQQLKAFNENGGHLIMFASHPNFDTPNYDAFIESFGVEISDSYICETDYFNTYQGIPHYLWSKREYHKYTTDLDSSRLNLFPESRGMVLADGSEETFKITSLFWSADTACVTEEYLELTEQAVSQEESDGVAEDGAVAEDETGTETTEYMEGPFYLGLVSERIDGAGNGNAVILGSAYFLLNTVDEACASANSEFFMNCLTKMFDVQTNTTIPAKSFEYNRIVIPPQMILVYAVLAVIVIPLVMIVTGFAVVIVRRKK